MPHEFLCAQCGRLVQKSDDRTNRYQCPHCQVVADVSTADQPNDQREQALTGNPFSDAASGAASAAEGQSRPVDAENPYQASATTEPDAFPQQPPPSYSFAVTNEFRYASVDFTLVLKGTWEIIRNQLPACLVLGIVATLISTGGFFAVQFVKTSLAAIVGTQTFVPGITVVILAEALVQSAVNGIAFAVAVPTSLQICRGVARPLSVASAGFIKHVGRLTGQQLIMGVIGLALVNFPLGLVLFGFNNRLPGYSLIGGLALLCSLPVLYVVVCMFVVAPFLIVDRKMKVWESMKLSVELMQGNKLLVFRIFVVVAILGVGFVAITCGIGMLLFTPFFYLCMTMIYLSVTGQLRPTAVDDGV